MPKFVSDILAKAGLVVDGVVTLNNTATGQTPASNDNSTKLATTAWVRNFVTPYTLPIASSTVLGGVKVGTGLSIDSGTGILSAVGGGSLASFRTEYILTATAGQTTFTISGGYTPERLDVFLNGVYLNDYTYTATDSSTIVLDDAALADDILTVFVYSPFYVGDAPSSRDICLFTASNNQTVFECNYVIESVDVYYNGSKLATSEYTANNGTSVTLVNPCNAGDYVEIISWVAGGGISATSFTATAPLAYNSSTYNFSISQADTDTNGYLSYTDWNTFNNKVSTSRTLTINGTAYDLSANRSWSIAPGGTTGQILAKNSGTNYDWSWINNFATAIQHEVKLGEAMSIGTPVYIPIAQDSGTNMSVLKASNSSEGTSSKTLGVIASGGNTNAFVQVITEGLLEGIDTSTAYKGDPIWLGTNGQLIFGLANKPVAPAHLVFIGIVTRGQSQNGEIFVKVQNGFELDELHDVYVPTVARVNNEVLVWESATSLWKNKSIATILGYTPANAARTLTINGTAYDLTADRTWTLTTSDIAEGTNLYYTQGRFDTAFSAKSTTNLSEGTNLYYTQARFDTAFAAKSTTNLAEGTNLYYTTARFDTRLATKSTTDLTEGTNLYYTTARVNSDFDTRLATKSTTNLAEGTNLYYTDARVGSYLTTNSYATQSYVSTQINNLVSGAPGLLDTLDELAAALGDDPNFASTISTALSNRLRVDTNAQGLTSTQQGYGRTNLGLGSLATLSSIGNSYITDLAYSKLTGVPSTFAPSAHTHAISEVTGLQTALDSKEASITTGTTSQYWRGDKSWQTLNTTVVVEGTNLYYTDARARAAITLTVTGSSGAATYVSGTLNIPTYTLAGLGGQAALSGTGFVKISGTTISYDNSTYLTGITSSQVTTALGYTPLSSYSETSTLANVTSRGASTSTAVTFNGGASISSLLINGAPSITEASLAIGAMGVDEGGQLVLNKATSWTYAGHIDVWHDNLRFLYGTNTTTSGVAMALNLSTKQLILPAYTASSSFTGTAAGVLAFDTSGNIITIAVPGGSVSSVNAGTGVSVNQNTGAVTVSIGQSVATSATPSFDQVFATNNGNGTNFKVGDDAWLGDINASNTIRLMGQQDATKGYIVFGNSDTKALGRSGTGALTYDGNTVYHAGNLTNLNQLTNGPGYLTGITSSQVTTALGYTPYNSTNPSGYITGISSFDTRSTNDQPQDFNNTVRFDFKANSTNGLSDGGSYNGVMYWRMYGSSTDFSGGGAKQIAYTTNGNLWHRLGTTNSWGSWTKIWDSVNLTNLNQLTNGPGYITSYTETDTLATVVSRGASTTSAITINKTGTLISHAGMTDAIGYNASYGTYIGSPLGGATYYIYANGQMNNNGTIVTLLHTGNISSQTVLGLNTQFLGTGSTSVSYGYSTVLRNENGSGGNSSYAPILHLAASDTMWQIQGDYGGGTGLKWRSGYAGTWSTGWWQIVHSGNVPYAYNMNQYVRTTDSVSFNNINANNGYSFYVQGYNNNGAIAINNASTYWGMIYNYSTNDWRLGYGGGVSQTGWNLRWDNGGTVWANSSMRAPIFYDSDDTGYYLDPNTSGTSLRIAGSIFSDGSFGTNGYGTGGNTTAGRVYGPKGGAYSYSGGGITGAIKIRLPFRANDCMWSMKVRIYNYSVNQTAEYTIGNYSYSAGGYNYSASFMGADSINPQTVRFGNEGGYDCIWIGETNTGWSYPVISVMDFAGGYSNGSVGNYLTNWDISIVTSFGTVATSVSPNVNFSSVYAYAYRGNSNVAGTGQASYHPSGIYSTGTNWLYGVSYMDDVRSYIYYDRDDTNYYGDFAAQSRFNRLNLSTAQPQATNNAGGRLRVSSFTNGESEINGNCHNIVLGPYSTRTDAGYYYAGIAINGLLNYSGGTGYDVAPHIWIGGYYRDTPGSERSDFIIAIKSGVGTSGTGSDIPQTRVRVDYSGNLTATGDITAYSDIRVKENIVTIDNALSLVQNLRGVFYNRTDIENKKRKVGVIAQETELVLPEVVDKDVTGMYNVSYGNMAGVLIEAIKELAEENRQLKEILKRNNIQ